MADTSVESGYALLIGVEKYEHLGPDKQLLAGRNDVLAYWKICLRLRYTLGKVRVLTTPKLTRDEVLLAVMATYPRKNPVDLQAEVDAWCQDPNTFQEATEQNIREGVQWLAKNLIQPGENPDRPREPLPGLMSYSGHGAQKDDELYLCPSNVTPELVHAVPYSDLRDMLAGAEENLTVFLDCCYAAEAAPTDHLAVPSLSAKGQAKLGAQAILQFGGRMFCASETGEISYQSNIGGHWRGAFSWAVGVVLGQWNMEQEGEFRQSTISHYELLFRARTLMNGLSFRQHPVLLNRLGNLPLFHYGLTAKPGETSNEPTAERRGGQVDPSYYFNFTQLQLIFNGTVVAMALVPNGDQTANGSTFYGGYEYWIVYRSFNTQNIGSWALVVNGLGVDQIGSSPSSAYAINSSATTWTGPSSYKPDQISSSDGTFDFGISMLCYGMSYEGNAAYSVTITWYNHVQANLRFGGLMPGYSTENIPLSVPRSSIPNIYKSAVNSFIYLPPPPM